MGDCHIASHRAVGEDYGGEFPVLVLRPNHYGLVGESPAPHLLPLYVGYVHTTRLPYVEHPYGKEGLEHITIQHLFRHILDDQYIVQDATDYMFLPSLTYRTPPT